MPHWRRIQTSLLDPAPLGTAIFRCHAVIYISTGRCESRSRYFRDGKLIIGAAKWIDLDNNIKIFREYFTKFTHASTFSFQHEQFCMKANVRLKYMSRLMAKPTKWSLHSPSLIRVFNVRSMCRQGLKLSSCGQRKLWSVWADAQADLSLPWAHMPFCWFCHEAAHISKYFLSFFDAVYICISLNYAVIKQVLSSKQWFLFLSFFSLK